MKHFTKLSMLLIGMLITSTISLKAQVSNPTFGKSTNVLNFTANVNDTVEMNVTVTGSQVLLGSSLSYFNVSIMGGDSTQFSVANGPINLVQILTELLGGGHKINVSYHPDSAGTHTSKLKIEARLLGLIPIIDTSIILNGIAVNPPQIINTSPTNGATGVATNSAISITYGENVSVIDASKIKINNTPVLSASTNGAIVSLTPASPLSENTLYTVTVGAGAIEGAHSNVTKQDSSFSFTTIDNTAPQIISYNPQPRSTIVLDSLEQLIDVDVIFNEEIIIPNLQGIIISRGFTMRAAYASGDTLKFSFTADSTASTFLTIDISENAISDLSGNYYGGIKFSYNIQILQLDTLILSEMNPNPEAPLYVASGIETTRAFRFIFNNELESVEDGVLGVSFGANSRIAGFGEMPYVENNELVFEVIFSSTDTSSVTLYMDAGAVTDIYGNTNEAYSVTYQIIPLEVQSASPATEISGNYDSIDKTVKSENTYAITDKIYVKKIIYNDGSVEDVKFMQPHK